MRAPKDHVSKARTPYAVDCEGPLPEFKCGKTYLTLKGYNHQMSFPDAQWKCPVCGCNAWFDDENFEDFLGIE
jgi:hypothetical protein